MNKYTFNNVILPNDININNIPKEVLKIAYKRGYKTNSEIMDYLYGDERKYFENVSGKMKGVEEALPILKDAIRNNHLIVIYQDYDVDGCAAGTLALECLRKLGARAENYMNEREIDGYGMCCNGINNILELYPDVKIILTVDNGIVSFDAVDYAKSLGLSVIVTDHHLPSDYLPSADAVIDIKRKDETYSFNELCGTGVIFKLMYSLYEYIGANVSPVLDTLDLVGLATIADVVPLVGENRALVKAGLRAMNSQNARPAIKVMLELTKREEVDSYTIGFLFAPMINALSRMGEDVRIATDILLSDDYDFLKKNVQKLIDINEARKTETDREFEIAISKIDNKNLDSCIIVYDSSFREGIIGIVAGRLKSEFNRPTIVFAPSTKEGIIKASCRSIDAFHLKNNLDKIANIMIGYGGHAKAAGLSIRLEDLDLFKRSMLKMTDEIPTDSFIESIELDDVLTMNDITVENIEMLRLIEPYGESNQEPIFGLHLQYDAVKFMGEDDKHVKYWHRDSNVSVIEWNGGFKEKNRINLGKRRSKVIGSVSLNNFNGMLYPQFIIK